MKMDVIAGPELIGRINTPGDVIEAQIRESIERGHPQIQPDTPKYDDICLVGSGPSLNETVEELRDLVFAGAKIVALNGAATWCVEHNFRPSAVVILDARASNARFVAEPIPGCKYFIASQCHADVWDAVEDRDTYIFHGVAMDAPVADVLNDFYGKGRWVSVNGGVTVATRALWMFRVLGYSRFHLFGIDCCWLDGQHHAFPQVENERERRVAITIAPEADPMARRTFQCAPWHVKQLDDLLQLVRYFGQHFLLEVHGRGVLAATLADAAAIIERTEIDGSPSL